jgi:hypothetical protein
MRGKQSIIFILIVNTYGALAQDQIRLLSPDGKVKAEVTVSDSVYYSVMVDDIVVLLS